MAPDTSRDGDTYRFHLSPGRIPEAISEDRVQERHVCELDQLRVLATGMGKRVRLRGLKLVHFHLRFR